MLRSVILAASRNKRVERLVEATPLSRAVVRRFVAGTSADEAVAAVRELSVRGLASTVDFLGEHTTDLVRAAAVRDAYLGLLAALRDAGLTPAAEVSFKLSSLGQGIDDAAARDNAAAICAAARDAGTTVTVDMEDHTTTDATLEAVLDLRRDFPETGAVLQAYLRRTEADCRELATPGSRVRLCKGAYDEPESVAFRSSREVDRSYVRCLNVLLGGGGYPMFATHDPDLLAIAQDRVDHYRRDISSFEFQMLYGVRPREQDRLAELGYTVRVYLPYGDQWYPYLMRRLAERPANLSFFARALVSRS